MSITRDSYINAPSALKGELLAVFNASEPLVFFDIGSCEGEDSIKYSRMFPAAKIYAIEALPKNQVLLRNNISKYGANNIELIPLALSDSKGMVQFHVSSGQPIKKKTDQDWDYGNKSSSLLPPDKNLQVFPWLKFQEVIDVPASTLDSICSERGINSIDFVHLDVQGAELKVLNGAHQMLPKIKMIWLEVETVTLYKDQPLKDDVEQFMTAQGFAKLKDTVKRQSGDQLYVNTQLLSKEEVSSKIFWSRFPLLNTVKRAIGRSRAQLSAGGAR